MKRVKLINDQPNCSTFRAVDSEVRRNVLSTLAEGWTMISELNDKFGEEANDIIVYYEKFKLIESRWEVNKETGRPEKAIEHFTMPSRFLHL